MQRKWAYIGGGSALLVAGVVASQSGNWFGAREAPASPPAATATATAVAPAADLRTADLDRLSTTLAEKEEEAAQLRTALAVRDSVLHTLKVSSVQREETLASLRTALAASEEQVRALQAEVETLRADIAALQVPMSFEEALVAMKPGGDASVARVETVGARSSGLDAMFAAKSGSIALAALPRDSRSTVEVHFDFASAQLTPGGEANALAAAVTLADMPLASVRVIGHTDTVGSRAANRRLAVKRARTVADALVAAGLSPDLIEIDDTGEAEPPVATGAGVPEPLNRTVAIIPVPLPTT